MRAKVVPMVTKRKAEAFLLLTVSSSGGSLMAVEADKSPKQIVLKVLYIATDSASITGCTTSEGLRSSIHTRTPVSTTSYASLTTANQFR